MKTSDLIQALIIIIIFIGLYFLNILAIGIKNIQDNWPEYRCNPVVMPFASQFGHETGKNFTYCIQTMQTSYMGKLLQPVNYVMSVVNSATGDLQNAINDVRKFISNLRNMITSIIKSVFGVFMNILIAFQNIIIKIKDLFGKVVGILASMMYILQGGIMTMQSAWNGPNGDIVRLLAGKS